MQQQQTIKDFMVKDSNKSGVFFRPTQLEAFRYWDDIGHQYKSELEFCQDLVSHKDNDAMRLGRAVHELIQNGRGHEPYSAKENLWFTTEFQEVVSKIFEKYYDYVLWERRGEKEYFVNGKLVTVYGTCDGLMPYEIIEIKTTSFISVRNYTESLQWRLYMDLFGCDKITYQIIELREYELKSRASNLYLPIFDNNQAEKFGKMVCFSERQTLTQYRYDFRDSILGYMDGLMSVLKRNGFIDRFYEKQY